MIDIWLFGALCIPFCEVLIATWIESLRDELRDGSGIFGDSGPTIAQAHSGKMAEAWPPADSSRKKPAEHVESLKKQLRAAKRFSRRGFPLVISVFVGIFWTVGLWAMYS